MAKRTDPHDLPSCTSSCLELGSAMRSQQRGPADDQVDEVWADEFNPKFWPESSLRTKEGRLLFAQMDRRKKVLRIVSQLRDGACSLCVERDRPQRCVPNRRLLQRLLEMLNRPGAREWLPAEERKR